MVSKGEAGLLEVEVFSFRAERKAENQDKGLVGTVGFAYRPRSMLPTRIVRDYKDDKGNWQQAVVAEISGAAMVKVTGAFVRRKDKEVFVSPQGVEVPWDVRQEVVRQLRMRYGKRDHAQEVRPDGATDADATPDDKDIPF